MNDFDAVTPEHQPVLYHEIIHALRPNCTGLFVDCTLGAGGHAWGILQASTPDGQLLGLDVDPQAIEIARQKLAAFSSRISIVQGSYTDLAVHLQMIGWSGVDGIVIDLGVSSMQLDTPDRGFTFREDAPLDMRFDPENPVNASDLVNELPEAELARLIYEFGEEPRSRQIARAIVRSRPISRTSHLADVVSSAVGSGPRSEVYKKTSGKVSRHPATRTFQALRIAVNRELDALQTVLPQAVSALHSGGRLAVISFHSLEDRIVKQFFRQESRDCICPPRQPVCTCEHQAVLVEVTRRPVQPQKAELLVNPRARSAKLRIAEKI